MIELFQAILIAAGLVLPGWAWAKLWGEGVLAAMMVSWLSIFAWTVLATVAGIPLGLTYLVCGQLIVGVVGWYVARTRGIDEWQVKWDLRLGIGWAIVPLLLVAIWKAVMQPLSGVDVDFRWNHLAEMMVKHGGLSFYPPTSAEDFAVYFWADGIPPLVSSLYAWTYLVAGETQREWTAIPVMMQWLALLILIRKLGIFWGGTRGGAWALLIAGASFLLQFAVNLGQETGCTALGAGLMVWGIARAGKSDEKGSGWIAGLGGAVLASSREYGIAIAGAGLIAHVIQMTRGSSPWRGLIGWSFLVIPLCWFIRTWVRSGNPWLSLSMGGLFPVNPVFADWISGYQLLYGETLNSASGWIEIVRLIVLAAAAPVVGIAAGMFLWRKQSGGVAVVLVCLATIGCWLISVPYTAGGIFYSMRVLSPVLVLGCGLGGALLGQFLVSERARILAALALALMSIDATARALTVSTNPWTTPIKNWPSVGYQWQQDFWQEQAKFIEGAMEVIPGRFVGDASGLQRYFTAQDRDFVPWWSPEVSEMFAVELEPDPVDALRSRDITHLVFHRVEFTRAFLERTGVLARLDGRIRAVMANDVFVVFELLPSDQKISGSNG